MLRILDDDELELVVEELRRYTINILVQPNSHLLRNPTFQKFIAC